MSKKTFKLMRITLTILLITLFNLKSFAQQTYYWYYDKKIPVKYEKSIWAIKFKQNKKADFSYLNNNGLKKTVKINEDFERVDFLKPLDEKEIDSTNIEFSIPALVIGVQDEPILMNGKIVIMPKGSLDIAFIEKKYNVVLIEKLNFGAYLFQVTKPITTLEIANKIHEGENVKWCSPDFHVKLTGLGPDTLYSQQYYLNSTNDIDINAPEAWSITKGCDNIRVAVLDEGVEAHEDLDMRVLQGYTPGTNNTFGAPIGPIEGHGVACAGIIAASHDNDKGIKGIAPYSKIVPVKLLGGSGYSYSTSQIAEAIAWSYQSSGGNADVLSNSWAFNLQGFFDQGVASAINDARTLGRAGMGCPVIFAAGNFNNSWSGVTFPANLPGVITVGAINSTGSIWSYSSRGAEMDLVCPSGDTDLNGNLATTDRMNSLGYETGNYTQRFGGTSAACPQVSGTVALMLSAKPGLTESQVRTILQQSATDMGSSGFDNTFGYGRLNAFKALTLVVGEITGSSTCGSGTYIVSNLPSGATVTWSIDGATSLSLTSSNNSVTISDSPGQPEATDRLLATVTIPGACSTAVLSTNVTHGVPNVSAGIGKLWGGGPQAWFFTIGGTIPQYTKFDVQSTDGSILAPYPPMGPASTSLTNVAGIFPHGQNGSNWVSNPIALNVRARNACGTSEWQTVYIDRNSSSMFSVSPNPASNELTVSSSQLGSEETTNSNAFASTASGKTALQFSVKLFDEKGKLLISGDNKNSGKSIKADVSQVPDGIYFLHIFIGKSIVKKQIIIKH